MICAHLAGIAVFATGGIGGVHRGAETSFDISADLRELAETPVTVVAAGAKAILDLPKTLEVSRNPRRSGHRLRAGRLPRLLVALLRPEGALADGQRRRHRRRPPDARPARPARRPTGRQPDPGSRRNPPRRDHCPISRRPWPRPRRKASPPRRSPPSCSQRIFELTEGRSLAANIALVLNNARLAAAIARALAATTDRPEIRRVRHRHSHCAARRHPA